MSTSSKAETILEYHESKQVGGKQLRILQQKAVKLNTSWNIMKASQQAEHTKGYQDDKHLGLQQLRISWQKTVMLKTAGYIMKKNGAQLKTAYDNMTSSSQATNCFEYEDKQAG